MKQLIREVFETRDDVKIFIGEGIIAGLFFLVMYCLVLSVSVIVGR